MKQFQITGKLFSLHDRFCVYDERGELLYTAASPLFSLGKRISLMNAQEQEVLTIQQQLIAFLQEYEFFDTQGRELGFFKQKMSLFHPRYYLNLQNRMVDINGDFLGLNYTMEYEGQVLAQVSEAFLTLRDSYTLTLFDPSLSEELVIGAILAMDAAEEANQNNNH